MSFLEELRAREIKLWAEGDRLRCSAPKGALTAGLKEEIAARKAGLLEALAAEQRGARLPLTPPQRMMWLLDRLQPGDPAYHVVGVIKISGQLEFARLQAGLDALVARHEGLRLAMREQDDRPFGVLIDAWRVPLALEDVSAYGEASGNQELRARIRALAELPFDLSEGKPFRASLFRTGPREHVLALVVHHAAADGWSATLLFRDLARIYAGDEELPPALSLASAMRSAAERGSESVDVFWRKQLLGVPAPLALPRQSSGKADARTLVRFTVGAELVRRLQDLSRTERVSLFVVVLTAVAELLRRYSGQQEFVLGTPFANRCAGSELVVGNFVTTLPLRCNLENSPTVAEALARVRSMALDAIEHAAAPFDEIARLLPQAPLRADPLPCLVALHEMPFFAERPCGLDWQVLDLASECTAPKTDLAIEIGQKDETLVGAFEYRPDALDRGMVENMARHLVTLLGSMCGGRDRSLASLPMMNDAERNDLVRRWNRTVVDQGPIVPVHHLIADMARQQPDATAITMDDSGVTYAGLESMANRLARRLQQLGAAPGSRVGILLDRSIQMVAAMLAAWKCGAAYVPLDPAYPPDRLEYIAADADIAVLVTTQSLARPSMHGSILLLDSEYIDLQLLDASPLPAAGAPEDVSYLIYTSGSTGRPKGVEIQHAALLNLLRSMGRTPGLTRDDTWLAITSTSFDISVLELFLPLITGARIVLATRDDSLSGPQLGELLESHSATVLQATPSGWRLLLESGWAGKPGLKGLCGGEAMPSDLARDLLAKGVRLWNVYGPTETTIWSTIYELREAESPVPIGHPVDNTALYILDRDLNPVPTGVSGELYIGGAGLARGYRNRPELTAERFVRDPFDGNGEARMYRTGDLARRRADGAVEYLGRLDHQVKIRGYRVEPGEIETVLREFAGVQDALVVSRDNSLMAYVAGTGVAEAALRHHVRTRVPEYMVPAQFVVLKALPRLPNGKIDRHSLPDVEPGSETPAVSPRTSLERTVLDVWSELLGRKAIGLRDNFFEIGGHSLAAVRVHHRLQQRLQTKLRLVDLFRYPTVESLASHLAGVHTMEDIRQ